jgi:hypothetical protein
MGNCFPSGAGRVIAWSVGFAGTSVMPQTTLGCEAAGIGDVGCVKTNGAVGVFGAGCAKNDP